jgi:hypothetical protein
MRPAREKDPGRPPIACGTFGSELFLASPLSELN